MCMLIGLFSSTECMLPIVIDVPQNGTSFILFCLAEKSDQDRFQSVAPSDMRVKFSIGDYLRSRKKRET